jgi:diaminohydroxyphosphoribosylaminopyrimidine deaminase / 5-amino-6-(5-phosphoribosylamino)uracil reductase
VVSTFMDLALDLARRAQGRTSPNPAVGCVVEREGTVVGEGYTQPPGDDHAEIVAIRQSGERARDATMYVTLEPCCHHGRTPPCTDTIISAGIRRVVVACLDNDLRVDGKGVAALRSAGIDVEIGDGRDQARQINRGFLKFNLRGLPMVTAKWAMSLDGKIATATGASKWITSEPARAYAHELRDTHDAVLIGALTALRDDPSLTVRSAPPNGRPRRRESPLRVVLDSAGRLPLSLRLFSDDQVHRTWVATTSSMSTARQVALEQTGVRVEQVAARTDGRIDVEALLRRLAASGVRRVLVEGGGQTLGSFFDAGLVDEVAVFVAPMILGGDGAPGPVGGLGIGQVAEAWRLQGHVIRKIADDVLLEGEVAYANWQRSPMASEFELSSEMLDAVGR